jgi:hypothetical protein
MEIMASRAGSSSGEADMPVLSRGGLLELIMLLKLCMVVEWVLLMQLLLEN